MDPFQKTTSPAAILRPDPELWARIQAASLDNGPRGLPLVQRLIAHQGWSERFADGAVAEYRKFIYLTAISSVEIVPSVEVEAVWREHLADGAETWESILPVMPGPVLPSPPDRPPPTFHQAFFGYLRTLDLYHIAFGMMAPLEYWPRVTDRFPVPPEARS